MGKTPVRSGHPIAVGPPGTSADIRCATCASPIRLEVGAGVREVLCGSCGGTTRVEVAHNGRSWQARRLKG